MKLHPLTLASGLLAASLSLLATSCADPYAGGHGHGPQVGHYGASSHIRTLPPGYRTETYNGVRYYSHGGRYYRQGSGGYVVVDAPRRPSQDRRSDYYASRSDYRGSGDRDDYRGNDDRRAGDQNFDRPPAGAREVRRNGQTFYEVNGRYYQRSGSRYVPVEFR